MVRMHTPGKGIAQSALPYKRSVPTVSVRCPGCGSAIFTSTNSLTWEPKVPSFGVNIVLGDSLPQLAITQPHSPLLCIVGGRGCLGYPLESSALSAPPVSYFQGLLLPSIQ